jgi:pimeloyl-ACP methyl ester carboxylesterase
MKPGKHDVIIRRGGLALDGIVGVSEHDPVGLVIFAHGSGSSRLSPRNAHVARVLNAHRMATLLFDLLTEPESLDRANVFDIELLAQRLIIATRWAHAQEQFRSLPVGYFGASTGAAAALVAAVADPSIAAVVSRGGRPDLAGPALARVIAPTLLIVGGDDVEVLELNHQACARMNCPREVVIVPGATHLFEEPGTLERVETLAAQWFERHFTANVRLATGVRDV